MTPKEKAKELHNKFINVRWDIPSSDAKICALIAVDEIIENNPFRDYGFKFDTVSSRLDAVKEFWQEVKQEIEQL